MGEVFVDVEYCGFCYIDLYVVVGDFGEKLGMIIGYEGVGCVSKVVFGVIFLKVGDWVLIVWFFKGCGYCEYCLIGWEIFCCEVINVGYIVDGVMV